MRKEEFINLYTTNPINPNDPKGILDYFQRIIKHMPNNVYWLNRECITMGCNQNTLKALGLEKLEDFVGMTYENMARLANWTEKQAESFKRDDMQVMETKQPMLNVEEPAVYDENGDPVYYMSSRVPLFDENGKVIGVVGISTNITDKKRAELELIRAKEKAESANKAKAIFIENMSHDIRTPITGAVGMIQALLNRAAEIKASVLRGEPLSLEQQEELICNIEQDAQLLMNSTDELLQLCNEILATVNLDSGQVVEQARAFDIRALVQHNMVLLQPIARDRGLDLSCNIEEDTPQYFRGLRTSLDRVLLNVISNALKFTEKGFVKVSVSMVSALDSCLLKIVVADSGMGIPADQIETIFEHFSRLTPSYKGRYKGSGLGLYAVKKYLEEMHGRITVSSEVGTGSQFTIMVPLTLADHSDDVKSSIQMSNTLSQHRGDILVVEDNPAAAMAIRIMLQQHGCEVTWAKNAAEGLAKATEKRYDLILMDIGLPDSTGLAVTEAIRLLPDPQSASVPIIALTGHMNERAACLAAGMQDLLNKPAPPLALERILKQYLF